jgi:hypothetical protein
VARTPSSHDIKASGTGILAPPSVTLTRVQALSLRSKLLHDGLEKPVSDNSRVAVPEKLTVRKGADCYRDNRHHSTSRSTTMCRSQGFVKSSNPDLSCTQYRNRWSIEIAPNRDTLAPSRFGEHGLRLMPGTDALASAISTARIRTGAQGAHQPAIPAILGSSGRAHAAGNLFTATGVHGFHPSRVSPARQVPKVNTKKNLLSVSRVDQQIAGVLLPDTHHSPAGPQAALDLPAEAIFSSFSAG